MNGAMRRRQALAVMRLELRKLLLGPRVIPLALFAGAPVFIATLVVVVARLVAHDNPIPGPAETATFFAVLYQFVLRGLVFLGCVWIFMNLFRGEVLERSLHYYFLSPLRREVLVAGKFAAGWLASTLLFGGSTLATMTILFGASTGPGVFDYLLAGPGLGQWLAYLGVTALACMGYGAVFLLVGLFFRNPVIPAVMIFGWEGINQYLPPLLKKISVVFYLQSLLPIPLTQGPFALLADPVPPWFAVPGILLFTAATLVVAALRIREMEIAYGLD